MLERENYISWDEYFMGVALLAAKRSKDPSRQVGACIVRNNKILATGYNGFPIGCSDECFYWGKLDDYKLSLKTDKRQIKNEERQKMIDRSVELHNKHLYVVHAELNAILNSNFDLKGSTIYVDLFPCNECAKAIIQAGIKEVVYTSDEDNHKVTYEAARKMFEYSGVEIRRMNKTKFLENLIKL